MIRSNLFCLVLVIFCWFSFSNYVLSTFAAQPGNSVVVGSKNFMENRLLAEMFAQLIEARSNVVVTRRLGLAGTQVCFEALKTGAIDLYPEYTGTGLVTILEREPQGSARETLNTVRREFLSRWNLWWMSPLGFDNSYALALPRKLAERHNLNTISDLAQISSTLKAGFGYEFVNRADGLPGLQEQYGLKFKDVVTMQQTLKYQATESGAVDVLDVYTTDGRLAVYDFVVLIDDKQFFPPYEATALVRGETLSSIPDLGPILTLLTNALNAEEMRKLNLRIQERGEPIEQVARDALRTLGLLQSQESEPVESSQRGLGNYFWHNRGTLLLRSSEHIGLAGVALGLGILLAVPLGLLLERKRVLAEPAIRFVGIFQTIPSIALLAFMIPVFGVGALPAIVALWIYSIFPMVRNTYTGLRDAAPSAVEAARALGMTDWQILSWVRLPLAAPVIMAGVRTSAVITVGTATLAAFIGAGGLGVPIVAGLQMADSTIILFGALPAAALALVVDACLGLIERWVRPKGIKLTP